MDILVDLNRRLHGLRNAEHLTVSCADLTAWRDEILRLNQFKPLGIVPGVVLTPMQERILQAIDVRGARGISCAHLIGEVYNDADGGCDVPRITIRVHIYKINLKLRPKGYEIRARGNDAMRYRLMRTV